MTTDICSTLAESPRGFVNNTSWNPAVNRPLLSLSSSQRKAGDWGDDQFVVSVGNGNRAMVVDIIVNNLELGDHPFHLVRVPYSLRRRQFIHSVCVNSTDIISIPSRLTQPKWVTDRTTRLTPLPSRELLLR
jgi:hypothetical protein